MIERMFDSAYERIPDALDRIPPGPALAVTLATINVDRVSPHDRITVLRAHDRMRSHYDAHVTRDMTAVLDGIDPEDCGDSIQGDAAAEIGAALHLTRRASESQLHFAIQLRSRIPRVWEALAAGRIDRRRAHVIDDATTHLTDAAARCVVEAIIDDAAVLTTGQLRARLDRLCIQADPDQARERYEHANKRRRLVTEPSGDGTAHLLLCDVAPQLSAAAAGYVDRLAKNLPKDDRNIDQKRADVAIDLLTGKAQHNGTGAVVEMTIPADTLTGVGDDPGELGGYGPVIADVARQFAEQHQDAEWRWVVTDPDTERPIAAGTTRRRPTAAQRRQIEARDRTCIFPGCRMPATNCDLDHRVPWAQGGETEVCDMAALCRYHHVIRHRGWSHLPLPNGDYQWFSKLGHSYYTSGRSP